LPFHMLSLFLRSFADIQVINVRARFDSWRSNCRYLTSLRQLEAQRRHNQQIAHS
jgi:hypothetical protein